MIGEQHVYRASAKVIGYLTAVMIGAGALLLFRMYNDDMPTVGLVWVGIGWVVFAAFLMALTVRSATALSDAGIEVRGTFSARVYPWPEIADIKVDEITGPASQANVFSAVIYDANLRRVALPFVNHKRLGPDQLEHEVVELRRRWESGRGPDWQPRTAEVEQRIDSRRSRDRVWSHALIALCAAFVLAIVIVVVVLLTAAGTPFVHSTLFSMMPLLILIAPALTFTLVAVIGLLRRRARR